MCFVSGLRAIERPHLAAETVEILEISDGLLTEEVRLLDVCTALQHCEGSDWQVS